MHASHVAARWCVALSAGVVSSEEWPSHARTCVALERRSCRLQQRDQAPEIHTLCVLVVSLLFVHGLAVTTFSYGSIGNPRSLWRSLIAQLTTPASPSALGRSRSRSLPSHGDLAKVVTARAYCT
eukprot:2949002-Amphidinium_carterae.1